MGEGIFKKKINLFLFSPASALSSVPYKQQALLVPPVPQRHSPGSQGRSCGRKPSATRPSRAALCVNAAGGFTRPRPWSQWSGAAHGTPVLCTAGWGAGPWRAPSAWAAPQRQQGDISPLTGAICEQPCRWERESGFLAPPCWPWQGSSHPASSASRDGWAGVDAHFQVPHLAVRRMHGVSLPPTPL